MKVKIHMDCIAARDIANKANQFGNGREFARWIRANFSSLDAHAVGDAGTVYVWDRLGNHLATARDEGLNVEWSLEQGRMLVFNSRPIATLTREDSGAVEVDELAKRIVAVLNKEGVAL